MTGEKTFTKKDMSTKCVAQIPEEYPPQALVHLLGGAPTSRPDHALHQAGEHRQPQPLLRHDPHLDHPLRLHS